MAVIPATGVTIGYNVAYNDAKITRLTPAEAAISGAVLVTGCRHRGCRDRPIYPTASRLARGPRPLRRSMRNMSARTQRHPQRAGQSEPTPARLRADGRICEPERQPWIAPRRLERAALCRERDRQSFGDLPPSGGLLRQPGGHVTAADGGHPPVARDLTHGVRYFRRPWPAARPAGLVHADPVVPRLCAELPRPPSCWRSSPSRSVTIWG